MTFAETALGGAYIIDLQRIEDDRGFFARGWCRREFEELGLNPDVAQLNLAFNPKKGTLRGLHFQKAPHAEVKVVRCTRGAIYDVIIDVRPTSPTFRQWLSVELTADNRRMLYVPEGFAQGYQTLADETEMCYQTTRFFAPAFATGVRYDDPAFGVEWPLSVALISAADLNWSDFRNE